MNRRDFFKLAGIGLAGLLFPNIGKDNDMQLADIWAKMANQSRLTSEEMAFLRRAGNETQMRNSFVAGNTTADNRLAVNFPFMPIFSEVLEKNTTSFTVNIPTGYKHLLIVSNGRTTGAGTEKRDLVARYNGDAGANYDSQLLYGYDVSGTSADLANTKVIHGELAEDGVMAGKSGSGFSIITNYLSDQFKTSLSLLSSPYFVGAVQGVWKNTAKIERIEFLSSQDDIKAGSVISVYGLS